MAKKEDKKTNTNSPYTHDAATLMRKFHEYRAYKQGVLSEWRLIRSLYKGQFWQVFSKHLKEYTISPDWNYFEYIVQGYLNSIYSGAFIGTLTPRYKDDQQKVDDLNAFVAYNWNKWGLKSKYLHIGENGELYNLGAVRVDWDAKAKDVKIEAISSQEPYFDPMVDDYRKGEALFLERSVNINVLEKNADFKERVAEYKAKMKNNLTDKSIPNRIAGFENRETSENASVSLIECFIRNDEGKLDQIFIINEDEIIFEKISLPFDTFPIVCYFPQRPDGNPYGNSKLTKVLNTVIALNLLDSMEATQPYRMLNRVRFVNIDGRINMRSFADFGNTPGASFEVRGNPRDLIYYQEIPAIPDLTNIKTRLENSIFQVTGVDPYYKGRATNSVQTTGATQAFQARVTMLTDNSRITMLEEFCEDLTKLIIQYYIEFGGSTEYQVPKLSSTGSNRIVDEHKLIFANYSKDKKHMAFDYQIAASTLLPMNQANLFDSAKALFEMQGQYNFPKQIITPEELIRYSDFPQKQIWLERLAKEDQEKIATNLVSDLTNFASIFTKMLAQGLSEEEAATQAIQILIEEKNVMKENPAIGRGFE